MTIPILIFHKKYVGSLQISVQNFLSMKVVKAFKTQVHDKELIISRRKVPSIPEKTKISIFIKFHESGLLANYRICERRD